MIDIIHIEKLPLVHPIVLKALKQLRGSMYFTPGSFFLSLDESESEILFSISERISDDQFNQSSGNLSDYQTVILLSSILSTAEGIYLETEEEITLSVKSVVIMCYANQLHRKKLIKCYYDKFTFDSANQDEIIMERLD